MGIEEMSAIHTSQESAGLMLPTQSNPDILTPHTKIQRKIVDKFKQKMDAKIEQATSPLGKNNGFTFPNPNAQMSDDYIPQRLPLQTSTSNAKYSSQSNGTYPNKKKLRSFMKKRPASQQRHSISTPIEYQNNVKNVAFALQTIQYDENESDESSNHSMIEHDDDESMEIGMTMLDEEVLAHKVQKIDASKAKNDSFMVKVSSPGSVMEEVMKSIDPQSIFDDDTTRIGGTHLDILNETDLAPTDDEPIPDTDTENESFDMKPIEFMKQETFMSEKEKRKLKIKQRRASSKRKSIGQQTSKSKKAKKGQNEFE